MLTEKILLTDSVTAPAPLELIDRFIGFDGFYCAPGAKAKGVLGVTIGPGEQAPVKVVGLVLVEAGAPIQAGSRVVSGELGVALQAASGSELPEATNGIAWTSASAPGEKILVKLE